MNALELAEQLLNSPNVVVRSEFGGFGYVDVLGVYGTDDGDITFLGTDSGLESKSHDMANILLKNPHTPVKFYDDNGTYDVVFAGVNNIGDEVSLLLNPLFTNKTSNK